MNKNEMLLLEAFKNMLSDSAELGLTIHKKEETSHDAQFNREDIKYEFMIKTNIPEITMHDSVNCAFDKVFSYRNIDDDSFDLCFRKEMDALVVPKKQQEKILEILNKIRKEKEHEINSRYDKLEHSEFTNSSEQTVGLPNMKDMARATGHED